MKDDYMLQCRNRIVHNIRYMLENSKVTDTQIEVDSGASHKYFERCEKSKTRFPSLQFVCAASELLGIDLGTLVSLDLTKEDTEKQYIQKFLQKLGSDTVSDRLTWRKDENLVKRENMENIFSAYADIGNGAVVHLMQFSREVKLYWNEWEDDDPNEGNEDHIGERYTKEKKEHTEIWLSSGSNNQMLCSTETDDSQCGKAAEFLVQIVTKKFTGIPVEFRNAIDAFMEE